MSAPQVTTPDGVRWTIAPEAAAAVAADAPPTETLALERWLESGLADIVKTGPHRTVYRVRLPHMIVYWKRCQLLGIRGWLRQLLRPPKARMEFDRAQALRAKQIPTIEPIAWGTRHRLWPSESMLITRNCDDTHALREILEEQLPQMPAPDQAALRRMIACELGIFLAKLHQAGIVHPDLHPGNFLVKLPANGVPIFHLLDLHAIRMTGPLDWPAARANLVLFHRYFQLRASRADRARFWRSYRGHRSDWPQDPQLARHQALELETATAESNHRFWRTRKARCTGKNRYFQPIRSRVASGFAVRDLDAAFLRSFAADPDAPFRDADNRILKAGGASTVIEMMLPTPQGNRPVILKRFNMPTLVDGMKNLLRPSPAFRSWIAGNALLDRGLPTARPLVMLHRRRFGLPTIGYLLCDKVADAVELPDAIPTHDPRTLRCRIDRLGQLLARMHDRQLAHRDLKAANLLMDAQEQFWFIDLVGMECDIAPSAERRLRDLTRLAVSFASDPRIRNTDRLRFLRAYFAWGMHGSAGWKATWRTLADAVGRKIDRNRKRGRVIA